MDGTERALSPVKAARRDRILDAAEYLFVSRGLRRTTIEGIAENVGMSKVTIYSYFRDKDDIFEAVASRFFDRLRNSVYSALEQGGSPAERVEAALIAKHGMVFDLVRTSPHAEELLAAKTQIAGLLDALDEEIAGFLGGVLKDGQLGRLLFHASMGIMEQSPTREIFEDDVATLVRTICSAKRV